MKNFHFITKLALAFFIIIGLVLSFGVKSQDSSNLILEEFRNKFREDKAFYPERYSDKFCFNTWSVKKNGKDDYYVGLPSPGMNFGKVKSSDGSIGLVSTKSSYFQIVLVDKSQMKNIQSCEELFDKLTSKSKVMKKSLETIKIENNEYKRITFTMNQSGIGDFNGAYQCLNNKDITWSIWAQIHPDDSFIPDLETLKFMLNNFHYVKAT